MVGTDKRHTDVATYTLNLRMDQFSLLWENILFFKHRFYWLSDSFLHFLKILKHFYALTIRARKLHFWQNIRLFKISFTFKTHNGDYSDSCKIIIYNKQELNMTYIDLISPKHPKSFISNVLLSKTWNTNAIQLVLVKGSREYVLFSENYSLRLS